MRFAPPKINLPAMPVRGQGPALPRGGMGAPTGTGLGPKPMGGIPGMRPPGLGTTGGPKPMGGISAGGSSAMPPGVERPNLGALRTMKKGGKVSSASKRADGIAVKGKTKGRIV